MGEQPLFVAGRWADQESELPHSRAFASRDQGLRGSERLHDPRELRELLEARYGGGRWPRHVVEQVLAQLDENRPDVSWWKDAAGLVEDAVDLFQEGVGSIWGSVRVNAQSMRLRWLESIGSSGIRVIGTHSTRVLSLLGVGWPASGSAR